MGCDMMHGLFWLTLKRRWLGNRSAWTSSFRKVDLVKPQKTVNTAMIVWTLLQLSSLLAGKYSP